MVEKLTFYDIPLLGLKPGRHKFTYEIGKEFFAMFEESPITEADLFVELTFDKEPKYFQLDFFLDGWVITDCDRCLENFELPVNSRYTLYVKYEDEREAGDDDSPELIFIPRTQSHLNISQFIYEYINLSVPIQKTCDMSVYEKKICNPDVTRFIHGAGEQNRQGDPRWDTLRDLNKS